MAATWIVRLEVLAYIDSAPTEGKLGFINVVASGEDEKSAEIRVRNSLTTYGWEIVGIEEIKQVDPHQTYQDDLNDLIERVMENPDFILLSTLYTYKPN